jgi:hypothetical protein
MPLTETFFCARCGASFTVAAGVLDRCTENLCPPCDAADPFSEAGVDDRLRKMTA